MSRASGLLETAARPGRAKIVAEISCFCAQRAKLDEICNTATRGASRLDVKPQLDIARYHMTELQINLMNFSAVAECGVSVEQGCLGACVAKLQENGRHERAECYKHYAGG